MASLDSHPAIKLMISNDSIREFSCKHGRKKLKVLTGKISYPLHYFVSIRPEEVENERNRLKHAPYPYDDEIFRYYPKEKRINYLRTKPLPSFVYNNHHTLAAEFKVSVSNKSSKHKPEREWIMQTLGQLYEVLKLEKNNSLFLNLGQYPAACCVRF